MKQRRRGYGYSVRAGLFVLLALPVYGYGRTLRDGAPPGDSFEQRTAGVHAAPSDLPSVAADQAPLRDNDLVLGVVIDGRPMAYPIRYIGLSEIVNDRVGETPVAATW